MLEVLASTTSHKREALVPTLTVFAKLGFVDLDLNLHHFLEKREDPAAIARMVSSAGQRIHVVSGGWCDFFHAPPDIQKTFDSVHRQVGLSRTLGASVLRLFFGRLERHAFDGAALDRVAGNIAGLAEQHPGMTFVFENHDGASLDPVVCRDILARVNQPSIRMNFDPINFERVGIASLDALNAVQPWVGHVHLKGLEAGHYCGFGEGDVDLTPALRRLLKSGYRGQFSVEYEGPNDGTIRLIQGIERARERIRILQL